MGFNYHQASMRAFKQELYVGAQEMFYKDIRFRSRLEGTWAMFFDICSIKWQYEAQVSNSSYLVDFYLPKVFLHGEQQQGVFVETKSSGAWGNPVERINIIDQAQSIIKEHKKPFLIIVNQPSYCLGKDSIWQIPEGKEPIPLTQFTLYTEKNGRSTFNRSLNIKNTKIKDEVKSIYSDNLERLDTDYRLLKAGEHRDQVRMAYDREQEEYAERLDHAEEIGQFVTDYWKDFFKEHWDLDTFANIVGVKKFTPQFIKRGDNYAKNEIGDHYYLWDENVIEEDDGVYRTSKKVLALTRELNKFFENKKQIQKSRKKVEIDLPKNLSSLRSLNEAIELEDYTLELRFTDAHYR